MNLSEFKAWFEGFTEGMDKPPSAKQWGRIKEKIGLIKDAPPVTQHVFHDHYYRPWRRWYYEYGLGSASPIWMVGGSLPDQALASSNSAIAVGAAQAKFNGLASENQLSAQNQSGG